MVSANLCILDNMHLKSTYMKTNLRELHKSYFSLETAWQMYLESKISTVKDKRSEERLQNYSDTRVEKVLMVLGQEMNNGKMSSYKNCRKN